MAKNEKDEEGENDETKKLSMETKTILATNINGNVSSEETIKSSGEIVTVTNSRVASSVSLNEKTDDVEFDQMNAREESGMLKELEASSKGQVSGSLLLNYFKSTNQPCTLVILLAAFLLAQALASIADVWVSYWYEPILFILLQKIEILLTKSIHSQDSRGRNSKKSFAIVQQNLQI